MYYPLNKKLHKRYPIWLVWASLRYGMRDGGI